MVGAPTNRCSRCDVGVMYTPMISHAGVRLADTTGSTESSAVPAVPQARYARLWKAVVSGTVPPRTGDLREWYAVAQHVLGVAFHAAQLDQVLDDATDGDVRTVTQHAA